MVHSIIVPFDPDLVPCGYGESMKEATKLEKEWKDQVGDKPDNPNSVDWSEIDKLVSIKPTPPVGTFSMIDFMERYKIGETKAKKLLRTWLKCGKIELIGKINSRYYYKVKE